MTERLVLVLTPIASALAAVAALTLEGCARGETCAATPAATMTTAGSGHHQAVATKEAPAAIGPYSQAIDTGDLVFLSGQIALDPDAGAVVGDVKAQTERILANLRAVLRASGLTTANVVKTTVYLTDLADYPAMNEVYATFFTTAPPARATVQVVALPKGARVEIEAIARR
jgi:2-iminobutanoate/2-iminopropanoate deaminase